MSDGVPERRLDAFRGPDLSDEQLTKILEHASIGQSIQTICKAVDISHQTLFRYIHRDPLFKIAWDKARQEGADFLADELQTAHEGVETVAEAMVLKVRSDNLKTIAAWRNPRKYSPKQQVEVTHTVDLSQALEQADARASVILQARERSAQLAEQHKFNPFDPLRDQLEREHRADLKEYAHEQAKLFKQAPLPDIIPEYKDINADAGESLNPGIRDTSEDVNVKNTDTYVPDNNGTVNEDTGFDELL